MPAAGVDAGQIEVRRHRQHRQLDPVLEGIAGHPGAAVAQYDEAMPKTARRQPQPTAVGVADEHHERRLRRAVRTGNYTR